MVRTGERLQRARTLLEMRRPADAERELRGVLAEEPQHALAHGLLGLALARQGRAEEAALEAGEAVRLAPDNGVTHYLAALVHQNTGRPREAAQAVMASLALSPEYAPAWEVLARVRSRLGDWPGMAEAARHGLALEPQNADLTSLLAVALTMLGQVPQARAVAGQALGLDPESVNAHWAYGRAALAGGDPRAAADAFREVLRLDPGFDVARDWLVTALKQRNPLHRMLERVRRRTGGGWRLFFLLPAVPPVVAVLVVIALLHWAAWVTEAWTVLRLARARATRLLFEAAESRVALACCGLLAGGVLLLVTGVALGRDAVGTAGVAVMALVTPVQEAAHTGSATGRAVLYGWVAVLAVTVVVSVVVGAFAPALLSAYAAVATIWLAAGVRRVFRPRRTA